MSSNGEGNAAIGARLRWAREQSGLSQGQVARSLSMHRPTISEIEAGRRSVKAKEIARFADLYDVKDDWIVRGDQVFAGESDPRIEIAARELSKLKVEDLDTILRIIRVIRSDGE